MRIARSITGSTAGAAARLTLLLVPVWCLAACEDTGIGNGPGAVSEGEARALDEAAEMLEQRNLPEGVLSDAPSTPAPPETYETTDP